MKRIERGGNILLALVLVCSVPSFTAYADNEGNKSAYTYTEIAPAEYQDIRKFCDGYAAAKLNDKWGYIDTSGGTVIPFEYDYALDFSEGFAVAGKASALPDGMFPADYIEYRMGFIDKENHYTPFRFRDASSGASVELTLAAFEVSLEEDRALQFYNGYCYVSGYLYGIDGYMLDIPFQVLGYMTEGLIPVYDANSGGVGYCDADGGMLLDLNKPTVIFSENGSGKNGMSVIRDIRPFNRGLAPACLYTSVTGYDGGEYVSESSYLWGFINTAGDWVIRPQYTDFIVSSFFEYSVFGEGGIDPVRDVNGKWGAIDMRGETVIPFEYDFMWHQHEGLVSFNKGGKYGYMDTKRNIVIPAQYSYATSFRGGIAAVGDGTSAWLIDTEGNKIAGTDNLNFSTYFTLNSDGSYGTNHPEDYVIFEENGKYGFGKVEYVPARPRPTELDSDAYAEVIAAIEVGLVPVAQQNRYSDDINRKEFAALILGAIEKSSGKDIEDFIKEKTGRDFYDYLHEYPFSDCVDYAVIGAYALGIVGGREDGTFDPYAAITRQEAAKVLTECYMVLGADVSKIPATNLQDNDISDWALTYVDFVYMAGLIVDNGTGLFSPTVALSRERAYVSILRLLKLF